MNKTFKYFLVLANLILLLQAEGIAMDTKIKFDSSVQSFKSRDKDK